MLSRNLRVNSGAHRLLKNFRSICEQADIEERQRVLNRVLAQAWVMDQNICAIMLRPNYLVWVRQAIKNEGTGESEPVQLPPFLANKKATLQVMESCRCGSDGIRTRGLGLDRAAC